MVRSHVDNLRSYSAPVEDTETDDAIGLEDDDHFEIECPDTANDNVPEVLQPQQPHPELPPLRRSSRRRGPPDYYHDVDKH